MHTSTMRAIDKWAGVPLCWLLTLADRVRGLFAIVTREEKPPKRIVFIKPSEMGALILSRPLMCRIKRDYPDAELYFLTFTVNSPVFDVLDVIPPQNILTIRNDSFFAFSTDAVRALRKLRQLKIDIAFDLEFFSRFSAILSVGSGARKRIGFDRYTLEGLYRGDLLTHKVQYNPHLHISRMYLSIAQVLRQPSKLTPALNYDFSEDEIVLPVFAPSAADVKALRERLAGSGAGPNAKIFIVNPGEGKIPLREWPFENFIRLARQLLEDEQNFLIIAGASGIDAKSERFSREINSPRCVNWVNKTIIRELLTLFSVAEALIVNDSGLAHLASLTLIKQFVLFGPETPRIFSPLGKNVFVFYSNLPCSPCLSAYNHRNSACTHNLCLTSIDPQEVYRLIREKSVTSSAVSSKALSKG